MPCPKGFVVKKRLEDTGLSLQVHSGPRIAHAQHHIPAGPHGRVLPGIAFIDLYVGGLNHDLAALRHCVARVDRQVHQHLFKLARVGIHASQAAAGQDNQFNARPRSAGRNIPSMRLTVSFRSTATRCHSLSAAEGEQALGQIPGRFSRIVHLADHLAACFGQAVCSCKDLAISQDDPKQIIEVVSQTAGDLANRLHLLGMSNLQLRMAAASSRPADAANIALDQRVSSALKDLARNLHAKGCPPWVQGEDRHSAHCPSR